MSLAQDFSMYFSDTYVGIRTGNTITPFYVRDVRFNKQVKSGTENDLSLMGNLLFVGSRVIKNKDGTYTYSDNNESINISDLTLEVPLLGYYKVDGISQPTWIYHLPQRSTKKGFTYRKTNISSFMRVSSNSFIKLVWDIFNDKRVYNERNFHMDSANKIFYKGLHIGKAIPEKGVSLKKSAKYLEELTTSFLSGV